MREKIFEYLGDYIQNKFPMYYNDSNQEEFKSFINLVLFDPEFKKELDKYVVSGDTQNILITLENGKIDNTIDNLVNKYAQVKYTKTWNDFNTLYNYIINKIKERAQGVDKINSVTLEEISRDIALNIMKNNKIKVSYYMNGASDDLFISSFDSYCERICDDCYERVKSVVAKEGIVISDKNTYDNLLKTTAMSIIHDFGSNSILSGLRDEDIKKRFRFYFNRFIRDVKKHIANVVNNMDLIQGIPVKDVVDSVVKMMLLSGEINPQLLLEGKLDGFIELCANKKRKEIDPDKAIQHIYKIIAMVDDVLRTDDEYYEIVTRICSILHDENNYSYSSIEDGKHDKDILRIFNVMYSEEMSVLDEEKPKEIEYKPKKKRISKSQLLILLLAVLATLGVGSLVYSIGSGLVDTITEGYSWMVNIDARAAVDDFDGFDYSSIYTTVAPGYEATTMNVMDFYSKVQQGGYDDVYGYIGFYRAYDWVKDDRLQIMDDMLDLVQRKTANNEQYSSFYKSISYNTCYLEFAMERLEEMGCEEIKDGKYQDVLSAYEHAMWRYPGEEPIKKLSDKEQKLIHEIMDMYQKYSKKCEADFGNILLNEQKSSLQYQSQGSGRKA